MLFVAYYLLAMSRQRKADEEDERAISQLFSSGPGGDSAISRLVADADDMKTEHAEDAIDYGDEDELAEDDLPEEEEPTSHVGSGRGAGAADDFMADLELEGRNTETDEQFDQLFGDVGDSQHDLGHDPFAIGAHTLTEHDNLLLGGKFDDFQDETVPEDPASAKPALTKEQEELEQRLFQENLLKFYYPNFKKDSILKMNAVFGPKLKNYEYHQPLHSKPLVPLRLNLEVDIDDRRIFKSTFNHVKNTHGEKKLIRVAQDDNDDHVEKKKSTVDLDEDLMLATYDWDYSKIVGDDVPEDHEPQQQMAPKRKIDTESIKESMKKQRYDYDIDDYDDDSIFDGQLSNKLKLDFNDPNLLFLDDKQKSSTLTVNNSTNLSIPTNEKLLFAKFNISNDEHYDLLKENYHSKIRSTVGNLNVEHSMPAIRLQSPYYKVKLTKDQLRDFHKQKFKVRPGQIIQFSKLKQRKRKRDKGKEVKDLFNKTTDLTLGDSAQTILLEHSEENPIVLSNFGMGSKLINYYRKKNEEDTSRPKLSIGETYVLGVQDKSPFWNFGFVEPGNLVPTYYNKMIRAPIFKHDVKQTDFLLIKTSGGGVSQKFYLKQISHLFLVGQLFPVVDIPGPHSRKVTTASKNRLKMIVYRVLKRNPDQRLLVKDISTHFPDQNDMQNRQRLKEFMEYQRSGDDQGYWKLKENIANDKLISPEDLMLLEAMQVTQQRIEDLQFYSKEILNEENSLWNLTKNFVNATQGKAMLQLSGDSAGKAFSFQKTSMKGGFKSFETNGHSYNVALQQKAYDQEISKTWYKQSKKFSDKSIHNERNSPPPEMFEDEETKKQKQELENEPVKYLKITRMVRDKYGVLQRKYEIIKDPEVIRAYVKRREKIEEELLPEDVKVSTDEQKNLKAKKILEEQLAKLEKNQERRNARKSNKEALSGKGIGKGKSTSRRCATCGEIGHIRTNKSCPMYNEANL